jgi:hypothetical protein
MICGFLFFRPCILGTDESIIKLVKKQVKYYYFIKRTAW